VALLMEQWLILFLVLMLPTPGGFGARFGVFIVLIFFVLPVLSFAMRAALAGTSYLVQCPTVVLACMNPHLLCTPSLAVMHRLAKIEFDSVA
jgi:hypothetical protein